MRFFVFLIVVVIIVMGIGLYRGWFSFTTSHDAPDDGKFGVKVEVDTGKIKADANVAKKKAQEFGESFKSSKTMHGTLVKTESGQLSVKDEANNNVVFDMQPTSKVQLKSMDVPLTQLQAGDRVTVVYHEEDGKNLVQTVTAERPQ